MLNQTSQICSSCIGDTDLKKLLKGQWRHSRCDFCNETRRVIEIDEIADVIDDVFRQYFELAPEEAFIDDSSDNIQHRPGGYDPDEVVAEHCGVETEVGSTLVSILSDKEGYDVRDGADAFYGSGATWQLAGIPSHEHSYDWRYFLNRIRYERRHFDPDCARILNSIFGDIRKPAFASVRSHIAIWPRGTTLFRARVARSREERDKIDSKPKEGLSPPPRLIASAGRMNPRGIPMFYGALDEDTCIAELRPPVGSDVIVGTFRTKRRLRLFDFTAFSDRSRSKAPSIFNPRYDAFIEEVSRREFLSHLHDQISRPVLPQDAEIDYLPTQAVAEYLRSEFDYDGIIYKSAQLGGSRKNVTLFGVPVKPRTRKRKSVGIDLYEAADLLNELWGENLKSRKLDFRVTFVKNSQRKYRITRARYTAKHYFFESDLS